MLAATQAALRILVQRHPAEFEMLIEEELVAKED